MKKTTTLTGNGRIAKLFLLLLVSASLIIMSCKNGDDNSGGGDPKELKLNCVSLSRAQVQAWVDSGWTKDSQTSIKQLLLQPYSKDASGVMGNMGLVAYPGQTINNVKLGGKSILTIDTTCKGLTVTGPVIFSDNTMSLSALKIFNPDGTLNKFDYILFTPVKFSRDSEYVTFKVEVYRDGRVDEGSGTDTWPCPPYCD
ncbi:MAG: hypothetical protein NTW29_06130 [Bacteroidetes bacterium]|nr:hypothetical protein [Bacteroidota bacterium]